MKIIASWLFVVMLTGLIGPVVADEGESELTAQEIGDQFVEILRDAEDLKIISHQSVRLWEEDSDGKVVREAEVDLKVVSEMTPTTFHTKVTRQEDGTPVWELILDEDGLVIERHWYGGDSVETKTYPVDERVGTGIVQFNYPMSFWMDLKGIGMSCATWEFSGSWVGGTSAGEGRSIRPSAERLQDVCEEGERLYKILDTRSSKDSEGTEISRSLTYLYDESFHRIGEERHTVTRRPDSLQQHERVTVRSQFFIGAGKK